MIPSLYQLAGRFANLRSATLTFPFREYGHIPQRHRTGGGKSNCSGTHITSLTTQASSVSAYPVCFKENGIRRLAQTTSLRFTHYNVITSGKTFDSLRKCAVPSNEFILIPSLYQLAGRFANLRPATLTFPFRENGHIPQRHRTGGEKSNCSGTHITSLTTQASSVGAYPVCFK